MPLQGARTNDFSQKPTLICAVGVGYLANACSSYPTHGSFDGATICGTLRPVKNPLVRHGRLVSAQFVLLVLSSACSRTDDEARQKSEARNADTDADATGNGENSGKVEPEDDETPSGGKSGESKDAAAESKAPPDAGAAGSQDAAAGAMATGNLHLTLTSEGVTRHALLHVPVSYNPKRPAALVLAFHGGGGGMANMATERSDLVALSDARGFLLAFPNGQDGKHNEGASAWQAVHCCDAAVTKGKSDVEFTRKLVATIRDSHNVDPLRIHATGFSNGGMLTHLLAAEAADLFASVAVNSGTVGGRFDRVTPEASILPKAPVPILMLHGTKDEKVQFDGGFSSGSPDRYDLSFAKSVSLWVQNNSCGTALSSSMMGTKGLINVDRYSGFAADVVSYSVEGHALRTASETEKIAFEHGAWDPPLGLSPALVR